MVEQVMMLYLEVVAVEVELVPLDKLQLLQMLVEMVEMVNNPL
jgi:hypothetical protein